MAQSVEYLGHRIDADGLHPLPKKVEAIQRAPRPNNVTELKSYLGLLSYYTRFLPNLSTTVTLAPLYKLLRQDTPWHWKAEQAEAFKKSKDLLVSSQVLAHYDPSLDIILACDASDYGLGAALSHRMPDGSEKPVAFISRTLSEAEKKYSQIEKEALSCVVGVTRFRSYLYGRHFVLGLGLGLGLLSLLNENKTIPQQAANCIQRWALTLASYEYTIEWRNTTSPANADALSRLPLSDLPAKSTTPPETVLLIEQLNEAPVTAVQIADWTKRNPLLLRVHRYILHGWPNKADEELKPYWSRRNELSVEQGCIIWSGRVVIPPQGRESVMIELHAGHPGVSRMKSLMRGLVWGPGIDAEVEVTVKKCSVCQQVQPSSPAAPLHPWQWPSRPWSRLHIDFAGPVDGKMLLIVIDAHSKWVEVIPMTSTTSTLTIKQLRRLFSQFGLPQTLVSDNGPQFATKEFEDFCCANGIKHIQVAPYHPSSNGLAERAVRIVKDGLKKQAAGDLIDKLSHVLLSYRITPQTTTGVTPAELMFGRNLRSRLDLLRPSARDSRVVLKHSVQKEHHDQHAKPRTFKMGDSVLRRTTDLEQLGYPKL